MLGLRATAAIAARLCDRILFVSEDSARWMGDALGLPPGKRVVVHHGVDALAWRKAAAKGRRLARPYVLSVSSIYRYKNFVRLIEAYAQLAETSSGRSVPDLVIIGDDQDPPYRRQMEAARAATGALADRIHFMGAVPYADVAAWYAGAELFVFPSYLETFGHPLLEALAAGVPLVAADTPVAREIAGDAALFADPQRSDALADAMRVGLWDPAVRADLVARGEERVREFTWLRAAESLLALFAEVLAERALGTPRKRERGAAASSGRIAGQREPAPAPASERGVGGA
jgi:glycosyltransferase involved in cell wall biosynthesis